jgi:hypothetical protein
MLPTDGEAMAARAQIAEAQAAAAIADVERLRQELDALRQQLNHPKS